MTDRSLIPFFDPERVQLVTDGNGRTPSGSMPWTYGDVPKNHLTLADLRSTDAIGPDDVTVLELPLDTLEAGLDALDRTPGTAALVPTSGTLQPEAGGPGRTVEWGWKPRGRPSGTDWEGLRASMRERDARVLGPGASVRVAGTADEPSGGHPTAGRAAIVLDDGTVAESVAEQARSTGVDVGPVIGVGAGLDVRCGEVLRSLADREDVDLVLGRSGPPDAGCVREIRASGTDTPIAVTAARGSPIEIDEDGIVEGESIARTLIAQAGAVPVDSLERIIDSAPALAGQPVPDPGSVMVISNAGGPAVMAVDAVGASGLDVARPDRETIERIDAVIPDHGSARNPLDLLADSDIEVYETVLAAALEDENVGAAVVISAPSALFTFGRVAEIIADTSRQYDKPIVASLMGGERTEPALEILHEAGIPNYFDPYRAVGALDLLRAYGDTIDRRHRDPRPPGEFAPESLRRALPPEGSIRLQGQDARDFARNLGVESVEPGPDDRSAGGGAATEGRTGGEGENERGGESGRGGGEGENERGGEGENGRGVGDDWLVMHLEARRTGSRGPIVLAGIAEFVDTIDDLSLRAAPLARTDAEEMLQDLRGADLFGGVRGRNAVAVDPLLQAIVGASHLLDEEPGLSRISFPGLQVTPDGVAVPTVAIDVE